MRILTLAAILILVGCSSATETGYKPRRLGDSMTVQRGYYAPAFSPERRAAEVELQQGSDQRSNPDLRPYN
jgi:hypothetical protein